MKISRLIVFIVLSKFSQAEVLDRVAAVVGDQPILLSEVVSFKKEITSNKALANIYRLDPAKLSNSQILSLMIEEKVVSQSVKDLDVTVSDTEVDNQIAGIAKQNNITKDRLLESLKHEGVSYETYKRNIRAQLEKRNIFDRELRKGGSGVSDSELRGIYNNKAPVEFKLGLIAVKRNKNSRNKLKALAESIKLKKLSLSKAAQENTADPLGWISPENLNPQIVKALKTAKPGEAVGPIDVGDTSQLLLFENERRGSEEGFQKAKAELAQQLQGQDFDRRFEAWLERKKKDLHIVVNGV